MLRLFEVMGWLRICWIFHIKECLKKFCTVPRAEIHPCWYMFEEVFCIEDTHELNSIAVRYSQSKVRAMICFLIKSKGLHVGNHSKWHLIKKYKTCIRAYKKNPEKYIFEHTEEGNEYVHDLAIPEWS